MTSLENYDFGPSSRNRLEDAEDPQSDGAIASLETFYFALNNADLDVLAAVWSDDELAQLNNPVGGIIRSGAAIVDLYRRIFVSGMNVQVRFTDAATYLAQNTALFAGREIGTYLDADGTESVLQIRTTRFFTWHADAGRWRLLHHHGSIDQPDELHRYQQAARR